LATNLTLPLSLRTRKRYQKGHWDAVIVNYKETELVQLEGPTSDDTILAAVVNQVRSFLISNSHVPPSVSWLPCHAIQLHPQGQLKAHVDSVRFSGQIVAGLSLESPSIMRLQRASPLEIAQDSPYTSGGVPADTKDSNYIEWIDLLLPPRSLYVLQGDSRFLYTHELLSSPADFCGQSIVRGLRTSLIFRDGKEASTTT
jgi:alkylated DNA repair protein alkB homolog 7